MRICYVSHSNSHFTKPYVDFFLRRGHEVHLVSLFEADLPGAIHHHPLPGPIDPVRSKLIYLRALLRVRAIVRSLEPCIVHAHYASSNGVLAAFAGVHPLVISVHGTDLGGAVGRARRALLKYALGRADLINPVSGSFDTLSRLREREVPFRFTFAATGPEERSLEREVLARGLSGQVTFLGGYNQDALPALLAQADVYISAARSDGASISLLEAMASGVFPVVSDVPGNRDWLSGQGDGLLFRPGDPDDLAACLEAACADEALRRSAAERNLASVRLRGERRTNLGRLEGVYARLAGAPDR